MPNEIATCPLTEHIDFSVTHECLEDAHASFLFPVTEHTSSGTGNASFDQTNDTIQFPAPWFPNHHSGATQRHNNGQPNETWVTYIQTSYVYTRVTYKR